MKLNRVLIVEKTAADERRSGRARRASASERERSFALVAGALSSRGIDFRVAPRFDIPRVRGFDLVVTFGGDGTFLAAAHEAKEVPLLGVNAAPDHSVGFFCAATPDSFGKALGLIVSGRAKPRRAPLIEVFCGRRALPCLALNDLLFAGSSPAETVRYTISAMGRRERQKSSGIWISSGPGSTAAIRSAGGRPLGTFSRRLQFVVREPAQDPGRRFALTRGVLPEGDSIAIVPEMRTARLYIDGHWHAYPVKAGARIVCRLSRRTLRIFL
ncbi:MAG: NAD(+)/NADH kinase [Proteobacteria bacterium]|nr:NAD(+)/NADH kinase [Pseudomonadota bacterium]